jgi:hypothetical protein
MLASPRVAKRWRVAAGPSPALRKSLSDAREAALRCVCAAAAPATDPATAWALCLAAGRYVDRWRKLEAGASQ